MDKVEVIQGSIIQHGHHNDRIYLMHLHGENNESLIAALDKMATEHGYGKIFAKIPATGWQPFKSAGYIKEARVPGFFNGATDGLFIAKFFSEDRQQSQNRIGFDPTESASGRAGHASISGLSFTACTPSDADPLATFYHGVFESYAFPIHQPDYIRRMMADNAIYFCIRIQGEIAAAAGAEIDISNRNCEMTDFATGQRFRKQGLAHRLLGRLDAEIKRRGLKTAYTIARADSRGMNRVFQKKGYRYAGRLIKNTQIGGRIRSMNVWYKHL